MTAVVFLENSPDLDRKVVVDRSDVRARRQRISGPATRLPRRSAASDAHRLGQCCRTGACAHFALRESGFHRSHECEGGGARPDQHAATPIPSGLLAANVSSAYDMAKLITYVSSDDRIASVMQKQYYTLPAGRRTIQVHSTNQLVMRGDMDVQAGKTGFITKAGYCLATLLRLPQGGPQVAVVVLGAKSNAGRFWETRHLFNWMAAKASELVAGTPVQAAVQPAN